MYPKKPRGRRLTPEQAEYLHALRGTGTVLALLAAGAALGRALAWAFVEGMG